MSGSSKPQSEDDPVRAVPCRDHSIVPHLNPDTDHTAYWEQSPLLVPEMAKWWTRSRDHTSSPACTRERSGNEVTTQVQSQPRQQRQDRRQPIKNILNTCTLETSYLQHRSEVSPGGRVTPAVPSWSWSEAAGSSCGQRTHGSWLEQLKPIGALRALIFCSFYLFPTCLLLQFHFYHIYYQVFFAQSHHASALYSQTCVIALQLSRPELKF